MWLFRRLVRRHFVRAVPWEVERTCSGSLANGPRLSADPSRSWPGRRSASSGDELATVEALVAKACDARPALEGALATLERLETGMARNGTAS